MEPAWLGTKFLHRVMCVAGHEQSTYPSNVLQGRELCRVCSWSSCDAFYIVDNDLGSIKLGITTGSGADRLYAHRRDGFATVLRFLASLADASLLEAHALKTLKTAGIEPVRGREYFERATALPVVLDIVDNW